MKPSIWPDWLDEIWAKSAEKGEGKEPESLAQHTWYVLARLSEFIRLRPTLPDELNIPRLWHILFWAAFIHDLGKAARGFQARLRKQIDRWPHRHEVLSLAFVDWLTPGLSSQEQVWLTAAVVSHHKDASQIRDLYPPPDPDFPEDDQLRPLVAELEANSLSGLWRWLAECPADWLKALGLVDYPIEILPLMPQDEAVTLVQKEGATRIHHWLKTYHRFVRNLNRSKDKALITGTLTLRGYLMNADHSASSHLGGLPAVKVEQVTVLTKRDKPLTWEQLYKHQQQAGQTTGSVLLTAPTGSGKTEAALLWAACQTKDNNNTPRLFYTLPYQASMNAMKLRLDRIFGVKMVGLQHGRALLAHYRMLLDDDYDDASPRKAAQVARQARNLAELNYPPVRVFSPYQMLKGPYRLRGYEKLLSDYHQALFIFDEIHAYEIKRLALILKTIEYLRKYFGASFMVMSATFPTLIKSWLQDALGSPEEVMADNSLFEQFTRHRLQLLDGELLDEQNLERIANDARAGRSILVACNLVDRAQAAYRWLADKINNTEIAVELLHSRFNVRDRLAKEKLVRACVGREEDKRRPIVLVATQVVEVSLDIDLDTIYSDPAPLEALVQRFGRINRRRLNKNLAPVYVFRQPDDGQKIYEEILVKRTLDILQREDGKPVNEAAIGDWLDEIYKDEVAQKWQEEFQQAAQEFEEACLNTLRAFESSRGLTKLFYQAFDGTEVLPQSHLDEYEDLKHSEPIRAGELFVPVSYRRLYQLRSLCRLMT